MKQSSKQTEFSKRQKIIHQYISSLQVEQDDFNQDDKESSKKLQQNAKRMHRQSQNIKKISIAYGDGQSPREKKSPYTKSNFGRKNQTEAVHSYHTKMSDSNDETSTTKSVNLIQLNRLNIDAINENKNEFEIETIKLNEKFSPIQPTQIRVESKKLAQPPKSKRDEVLSRKNDEILILKSPQKSNEKQKLISPTAPKTEGIQLNKQKLKEIYDKIRNPQIKQVKTAKLPVSQKQITQPRIQSRHKIQSENDYLSKLTGRSKGKVEEMRVSKQELSRVSTQDVLSGKISIIWIFTIKSHLPEQVKSRITQMYNPLFDDDRAVPFLSNPRRIQEFVNIPNCYFKIVTDIECAQKAIGFRIYSKVIEFYIWNEKGNDTLLKALEYKNITRKVKGIFNDWQRILNRAEDQIEEQIAIYRINSGLEKRQRQRKFPNFLKLTDTDKTEATLYRINLYGAIKLLPEEKKQHYDNFMRLVLAKYEKKQDQLTNIQDYIKIDHVKPTQTLDQARLIIQFYVRESFYYQLVNSMLRTMKTSEEFKPCVLPFNQTYHSIKLYYGNFLTQMNDQIPQMTLYRGCKLSKKDSSNLRPGVFVEMFGFMSTSKSEERALDFVDRDGYLFVIHVKKRNANMDKFKNFDHGFVDINRYGLASAEYSREEEVLFNALNVYQVQRIELRNGYKYIHLEYGVIFDLLQKPRQELTQDEYETLVNYHYCTKILGKIEDQGDVFLYANELVEAKEYYDKKIKQGTNLAHNYYKLAAVQKECGQIDEAEKNANLALKLLGQEIDLSDREKCLKIFGIHSKNAEINLQKQDYLTADSQIDDAMSMLCEEDLFERAVMLRQRGEIKFKKGEIKNAERDFEESQNIFENIRDQGKIRKMAAYKKYYLSHLSLFCTDKSRTDLKKELKDELKKVQELEYKIQQMNETIEEELVKINKSLKDVSLYVEDRDRYEIQIKKAQSYLYSLKARKANDPELKAKLLSMQAMINDYQQLAETEKLMYEAIELIESKNPFDLKVADYSKILAKMQKAELQKYTKPPKQPINEKPQIPIPYDSHGRRQIYERCKKNFTKTLNVLLYHAKDKASPEILDIRNQLGDLTFGENDYAECQKILKQAREGNQKLMHSQMAKTLVTMAKISYARGQLKNSFETLKQAHRVLQEAMVNKHKHHKQNQKKNIEKYKKIFQSSDTYLTIQFIRINIYHKQKSHDLALKAIDQVHQIIVKKVGNNDSHPMLAELLQLKGSSEVFIGHIYAFDEFFQKAISLRQKQYGYYHPVNAKTCCAYAKYLLMVKDIKRAQSMLEKAVEIISAYEQTNPHYWAIYYSQGYFNQEQKEFDKSEVFYEKSWQWTQKYFNKSHIAIKEVMLRYANSLNRSRKYQQSIKIYQKLEQDLEEGLRESNRRHEVNEQVDDEKVSLKKLMYSQLCDLESEDSNRNEGYMETTQNNLINTSLYKSKLMLLRNTYHIQENLMPRKLSQIID